MQMDKIWKALVELYLFGKSCQEKMLRVVLETKRYALLSYIALAYLPRENDTHFDILLKDLSSCA